jgi:hypothetical protein
MPRVILDRPTTPARFGSLYTTNKERESQNHDSCTPPTVKKKSSKEPDDMYCDHECNDEKGKAVQLADQLNSRFQALGHSRHASLDARLEMEGPGRCSPPAPRYPIAALTLPVHCENDSSELKAQVNKLARKLRSLQLAIKAKDLQLAKLRSLSYSMSFLSLYQVL